MRNLCRHPAFFQGMFRQPRLTALLVIVLVTVTLYAGDLAIADEPGCHNLISKRRVYRAAQIGFATCTLYTKKDCATGTEIEVNWKNKSDPVTAFTPGARWYLPGTRGSKMASWHCEAAPE